MLGTMALLNLDGFALPTADILGDCIDRFRNFGRREFSLTEMFVDDSKTLGVLSLQEGILLYKENVSHIVNSVGICNQGIVFGQIFVKESLHFFFGNVPDECDKLLTAHTVFLPYVKKQRCRKLKPNIKIVGDRNTQLSENIAWKNQWHNVQHYTCRNIQKYNKRIASYLCNVIIFAYEKILTFA